MQNLQYYKLMDYMAHYERSPSLNSQGLHFHDYFEFYFHIKGGRLYCVDDNVFELKTNHLIIIPPLHMHGLVCDRDLVDYQRAWLYLTPETLSKCGFEKFDLSTRLEEANKNHSFANQLGPEDSKIFISYVQEIEKMPQKKGPAELLSDYSKILKILEIVERNLTSGSKLSAQKLSHNPMHNVLHYINEHYSENLSIKELSSHFNMSESSLSHEFKKYSNKGLYEYILYKRIIKAKELLFTDMNLTQIALECGFNDYSNFLRVFKKLSGTSPKEYKKWH